MAIRKNAAARRTRPARVAKVAAKAAAKPPGTASRRAKVGRVAKSRRGSPRPPDIVPASVAGTVAAAETAANELRYLQARRIEDLAQGFVSLTSELWIVKDRLAVLEQVLDRHGIPAPSAVDAYTPEGEFKAKLDAERRAWAQRMIAALFPRGLPKVD